MYINGLKFEIQDEMNLLYPNSMEEVYLFSLKAKEKLARKIQDKSHRSYIGRGSTSGLVEASSSS